MFVLAFLPFTQSIHATDDPLSIKIDVDSVTLTTEGDNISNEHLPVRISYNTTCTNPFCDTQSVRFAVTDTPAVDSCGYLTDTMLPTNGNLKNYFSASGHTVTFDAGSSSSLALDTWSTSKSLTSAANMSQAYITLNGPNQKPEDLYIHARVDAYKPNRPKETYICTTSSRVSIIYNEIGVAGITGLEKVNLNQEGKGQLNNVCVYSSTTKATLDFKSAYNFQLKQDNVEAGIPYSIKVTTQNQTHTISEVGSIEGLAVNKTSEQDCLTPNTIFDILATDQNALKSLPPGTYQDTVTVTVSAV